MQKIICCTHNGAFHADDVVAYTILSVALDEDVELVRSRNPENWERADICFDVSGRYDGEKFFDHHQTTADNRPIHADGTPMSSAGLIWEKFGMRYLEKETFIPESMRKEIFNFVKDGLIREIDAIDNGVPDTKIVYGISPVLAVFSPIWSPLEEEDAATSFLHASKVFWDYFRKILLNKSYALKKAEVVRDAFNVPILDAAFLPAPLPWEDIWMKELIEQKDCDHLRWVAYPKGQEWRVQALPSEKDNPFSMRCPFPETWRGRRNFPVQTVNREINVIFAHANGFLCVVENRDDALALVAHLVSID